MFQGMHLKGAQHKQHKRKRQRSNGLLFVAIGFFLVTSFMQEQKGLPDLTDHINGKRSESIKV
jgi:hypothetical protein